MPLTPIVDAWPQALYEDGPESLVTAICERAYATMACDALDLEELRRAVAEGRGPEILRAMPEPPATDIRETVARIAAALGA